MRRHDLDSLVQAYGGELVSIPTFAKLLGLSASALRVHIRWSEKQGEKAEEATAGEESSAAAPFPAAVSGGSSPSFLLGELVDWVQAVEKAREDRFSAVLDQEAVAQWAVDRSAGRCAGAHGADATFRLIAVTALLLADGWHPDDDATSGASSYLHQLQQRARALPPAPRSAGPGWSALPPEFTPDPDPVRDPRVIDQLVEPIPSATEVTPDDPANVLIAELARAWSYHSTAKTRPAFVGLVEEQVALQIGRTPTGRPKTPAFETRLLIALADLRPGHIVLDPAIGEGAAALAAHAATADPKGRQRIGIVGREIDERTWCYTKMRFGLRGIAHDLGDPEADALKTSALPGRYERVIADPGASSRQVRGWMERVAELVTDDGIAVAQFAGADTIPPRERSGAWDALSPHVVALVLSPARAGAPTGTGTFVIQRDFAAPILLAQIQPSRSRKPSDDEAQRADAMVASAVTLVRRHREGPVTMAPHWKDDVFVRTLPELTFGAFGTPGWDDTKVLRDAIERRLQPILKATKGHRPELDHAPSGRPRRPRGPLPDKAEMVAWIGAQRAVSLLRWLTDLEVALDPPPIPLPERPRARFAAETTTEIRTALERLERRIRGVTEPEAPPEADE